MTVTMLPAADDALFLAQVIDAAAARCAESFARVDRAARREGRSIPTPAEKDLVSEKLWRVVGVLDSATPFLDAERHAVAKRALHDRLNPWLLRSRIWARAYLKPHGYDGDFRLIEWMYDLEADPCADPTQPAIVNCLDFALHSVHSMQAVWHRRLWFRQLIERMWQTKQRPIRVLDVACGGSRYCREFLQRHPGQLALVAVDQDPAAIAFLRSELSACGSEHNLICGPIKHLAELVPTSRFADEFDVVISAGLFDYLENAAAVQLLEHLGGLTRPGGTTAISNFSSKDPSRAVKEWICDWRLLYRDEQSVRSLFDRTEASVTVTESPDTSLLYGAAIRRPIS
jgi:extracellular factor (EF) 3-hydroxypalmitic acid methyl ester biosynthesis protein